MSDLSNDQLMEGYSNAKTLSLVGGLATGTGLGLMAGGALIGMARTTEDMLMTMFSFGAYSSSYESYGGGIIISGALLALGGTITWISGGSRKKKIKPLMESRGLVSNVSIYPGTGYEFLTDSYYPAVTISMRF